MKKIILAILLISNLSADNIYATFTVEANRSANLAFSSGGIVDEVLVDVATVVKEGDTLVRLKNSDLKAMVQISKTALKYAKKEYNRQLKVKKMIDESQLDRYAFEYENAKNQLAYQEALLDKTTLKAPFDGVIFQKSVEVGDVVSGAMLRTILKIQSLHKRKLIISIDQKYWQKIAIGDIFEYRVDGDTQKYRAKISKIYPYANSTNRKIVAEVMVEDFVVGLFGDGYIICTN